MESALFDEFREGIGLAKEIELAKELHVSLGATETKLELLSKSVGEKLVGQSLVIDAIDNNRKPFVHCFRINELSQTKDMLPELRVVCGQSGRFAASEDYRMSMPWTVKYYRDIYPIGGSLDGFVTGIDLPRGDLVMKGSRLRNILNFGARTWVNIINPETMEPSVNLRFT